MTRSIPWSRLEKPGVILVALHSLLVGGLLLFIPDWTLKFAGWPAMDDVFFIRQSGAFHFVWRWGIWSNTGVAAPSIC